MQFAANGTKYSLRRIVFLWFPVFVSAMTGTAFIVATMCIND